MFKIALDDCVDTNNMFAGLADETTLVLSKSIASRLIGCRRSDNNQTGSFLCPRKPLVEFVGLLMKFYGHCQCDLSISQRKRVSATENWLDIRKLGKITLLCSIGVYWVGSREASMNLFVTGTTGKMVSHFYPC